MLRRTKRKGCSLSVSTWLLLAIWTICLFIVQGGADVQAQGYAGAESYYKHNYAQNPTEDANQPLVAGVQNRKVQTGTKAQMENGEAGTSFVDNSDDTNKETQDSEEKPKEDNPNSDEPGRKIAALGLIVDSSDIKQTTTALNEMAEVCAKNKIPAGKVFLVGSMEGDPTTSFLAAKTKLLNAGADFINITQPPAEYHVKLSPSWTLEIEGKEVILEGLKSPAKFINNKSEFVAPK